MTESPSEASPYPLPGEVIDDKYVIEKMLGEGGMGAVLRATHKLRKAQVALKFMSPAIVSVPGIVERFFNEGVAISKIESEHVVKVFDVARMANGQPYLVMEFMKGEDLSVLLEREGRPHLDDPARCVHFTLQILRGLQIAHRAGIVHRDMKPANCFVTTHDEEHDFVKLLDFGISKLEQPDGMRLTAVNSSMGTPLYMSPEQAANPMNVDARSDLYAVGCILFELLTGTTPFTAPSGQLSELLFKIFSSEPTNLGTLRPDLPPELVAVVMRALVKDPAQRYQSARDMAEALAPFADGRSADVVRRMLGRRGAGYESGAHSSVAHSGYPSYAPRASAIPGSIESHPTIGDVTHPGPTARSGAAAISTPPSAAHTSPPATAQSPQSPQAAQSAQAAPLVVAPSAAGALVGTAPGTSVPDTDAGSAPKRSPAGSKIAVWFGVAITLGVVGAVGAHQLGAFGPKPSATSAPEAPSATATAVATERATAAPPEPTPVVTATATATASAAPVVTATATATATTAVKPTSPSSKPSTKPAVPVAPNTGSVTYTPPVSQ